MIFDAQKQDLEKKILVRGENYFWTKWILTKNIFILDQRLS